jgi:hypothetical protein
MELKRQKVGTLTEYDFATQHHFLHEISLCIFPSSSPLFTPFTSFAPFSPFLSQTPAIAEAAAIRCGDRRYAEGALTRYLTQDWTATETGDEATSIILTPPLLLSELFLGLQYPNDFLPSCQSRYK